MTRSQKYAIEHFTAPLSESAADTLVTFLQHKGRPWVDDIRRRVRGEVAGAEDHYFVIYDGPRVVGHVWYTVSQADPRLGLIGHVLTHPDYRRRGIARQLIERAMNEFHHCGGMLMQLFTSTLFSLPFYEQLGFEKLFSQQVYHDRDWYMRSPHGSDQILHDWFASSDRRIRPLGAGDLPQYCLLYNAQHDHVLKDRAQQIGCGLEAELAFIDVTNALSEGRATVCVVENSQTIIGAASLIRSVFPHQSHVAIFDIYWPSAAITHIQELAQQCLAQRAALHVEHLYALAVDGAKRELFVQLGFVSRGILKNHYQIAQQRLDCELFELSAT